MDRREFFKTFSLMMLSPYLGNTTNSESEEELKLKTKKSSILTIDSLLKLKSIGLLRENDFSLTYKLFENTSNNILGTASINFNRNIKRLDLGVDEFVFIKNLFLSIASIFSTEYDRILNLRNIRYYLELDDNFRWLRYGEAIPKRDGVRTNPRYYEFINGRIYLNGDEFLSSKELIHNPLSAIFEILNGNRITNFGMVSSGNCSFNLNLTYNTLDDLLIVENDFEKPFIESFKKIYAILYNNIPITGYIREENENNITYIRGELKRVNINNEVIF